MVMNGRKAYLQAGAGIVADSVPEQEYEECVNKAKAVVRAADGGFTDPWPPPPGRESAPHPYRLFFTLKVESTKEGDRATFPIDGSLRGSSRLCAGVCYWSGRRPSDGDGPQLRSELCVIDAILRHLRCRGATRVRFPRTTHLPERGARVAQLSARDRSPGSRPQIDAEFVTALAVVRRASVTYLGPRADSSGPKVLGFHVRASRQARTRSSL